ncbi:glycosyltransferase family 2 protein [bacterium]|nr:glycosyltransferase family 2 protein [bacterium]
MIKFKKLFNPLTRLKKVWASRREARRLEKAMIDLAAANRLDDLVVSFTSIPSRLGITHLTVRSLLLQTRLPHKIVLWLHHDLKNRIPVALASLQNSVFEIRFSDLTCSHRKLVCAWESFPDHCIVTCDDDCMYESRWLEKLHESHLAYPHDVIGGRCRRILYDDAGALRPYKSWSGERRAGFTAGGLLAVGYAGILYPPRCLLADLTDRRLFLELAPRADDLWFKAMSLLNGVAVRTSLHRAVEPIQINRSQKVALRRDNLREDGNYHQWLVISRHYHIAAVAGADGFVLMPPEPTRVP